MAEPTLFLYRDIAVARTILSAHSQLPESAFVAVEIERCLYHFRDMAKARFLFGDKYKVAMCDDRYCPGDRLELLRTLGREIRKYTQAMG